MHEWGDSGITAVLLAIGIALLVSFVVAQQARTRAARFKEIRRLQSVAAEQARREEEEAHAEYSSMVASRTYCAVCFNPTATRCSRCKAVHYCSSTCQVKHWKDGHKQECRAPDPSPSPGSSSNGSRSFSEAFTSSSGGSSASGGSRTLSEVCEVHNVVEPTLAELARINTPAAANGNGTLLGPKKVLFPYDYFVKFFNWERLKVPPCGLLNCGNSCFANVVLQCLTYTRPLTAYLLEGTHGEECRRSDWCFMCELQDHVWRVRQSQNPFSPIRILSRIRNIGNHLGYGRQEDAHEFMRFAIDSMQSICLDEAGGEKAVDPRSQETTFIHYIFGGHLQSQVKCIQCLHESNRYENMMDLAVEIQGCVESLEDALTQFTAPEWLDGENKYKCDRCNAYVKARKRLTLHEAPNILTIALKRFQSGKFGKLNKRVTFPEVLDVSPYMSGKGDRPPLYKLYAVVVHVDMLNASFFGHYICYVKDSQGLWYKIDDSKVKEVDLEKVMAQRAYMLFYTRSIARPPPLIDGAVSPYPVSEAVDLGRIGSDRHGGLKVFPSSHYVESEEMLDGGGTQGLHAMVDFNQMVDYVEDSRPPTVTEQHLLSNGEIASEQQQPSSWEAERARSSTSNDDEIETEDAAAAGCIASSSSSLTQTSPYMTSFTSNQGLWIPTQGFVCQVPEPGSADGAEYAAWDSKSSLLDDFSEVSLQPGTVDNNNQPCNGNSTKIGKRRLEDGLSPLPTPKPLDTDQLPAWPAGGGQVRPSSCLSPVHHLSSTSPMISSMPDEFHSSLPKYGSELTGEPVTLGTFPVQMQRVSSELVYFPPTVVGESTLEPEVTDYIAVGTTGSEEEAMAVRAKRQHVDPDSEMDPIVRLQGAGAILQAVEQSNPSDSGEAEMDWDAAAIEPPPVFITSGVSLGDHPREGDSSNPSAAGRVVLNQQVARHISHPLESDGLARSSSQRGAGEVHESDQSSHENTAVTMESYEDLHLLSQPPGGLLQEVLEAAACHTEVTGQNQPSQSVDRGVTDHGSDTIAPKEEVLPSDTLAKTVQETYGSVPHSNGPAFPEPAQPPTPPAKVQKSKSTSKPLFAPGFLNKARTPAGPKGKSSSHTPSKAAAVVENGHSKNIDEEGQACENVAAADDQKRSSNGESHADDVGVIPEVDQLLPPEGGASLLLAAANDDTSTVALPSGEEESSCGNCMTCELCSPGHSNGPLENGHPTVSGVATPDSIDDHHIVKIGPKNDHGSSSTSMKASVNCNGSWSNYSPGENDEEPSVEPVSETVATAASRSASGKQKQGRNETCNCGSQRKWKKCCGKTGVLQPERQTRRLVV